MAVHRRASEPVAARAGSNARRERRLDGWTIATISALVVPVLVAMVVVGRRTEPFVDDFAITQFQLRHLFTASTSLTGLYSRPGWNHPGPFMFWILEPFWLAGGRTTVGMRLAAPMVAGTFVVTALVLAARVSRAMLGLVALTIVGSLLALPIWTLQQPWNPWMVLPALLCFLVLVLRVSVGRTRDLIGVVVVGSFIVQVHVGSAALVITGGLFALISTAVDARSARALPDRWRATVALSLALGAALWIAPTLGVLRHDPGNLAVLGRYFLESGRSQVGMAHAAGIMADQFRWPPPGLGAGYREQLIFPAAYVSSRALLAIPLVLLAVGGAMGFGSPRDAGHRRRGLRIVVLAAMWFGVAVVAIAQADEPRAYTFAWVAIVASFSVVAPCFAITQWLVAIGPRDLRRAFAAAVLSACILGSLVTSIRIARSTDPPLEAAGAALVSFRSSLLDDPIGPGERVRVESAGTLPPSLGRGIVDTLDASGVRVGVPAGAARIFNRGMVMPIRSADRVWYVSQEGAVTARLAAIPGARIRWSTTPLDAAEERELVGLQSSIAQELASRGQGDLTAWLDYAFVGGGSLRRQFLAAGVDGDALSRLATLNAAVLFSGGCRCSVVEVRKR